MATTAKVFISSVTANGTGETTVYFTADYADGANKEWAKYTPNLSLSMTVLDEVAADWKFGDKFTLVFQKDSAPLVIESEEEVA
jgi:hypothetical protein